MRYKSVGIAAAALVAGVLCAGAADMQETRAVTTGFKITQSGANKLESTVGEVSYSTDAMRSNGIILRGGHSGTSHSPGAAYSFTATTISFTEANLNWTQGLTEGTALVDIRMATYAITAANYSSAPQIASMADDVAGFYAASGLSSGTTYYLAIRVRDASNIYGRISTATFVTGSIQPRAPVVSGSLLGTQFTLSWPAVQYNASGGPVTISGYEVYYSTSVNGPVQLLTSPALPNTTLSYSVTAPQGRWYFVKAVDSSGAKSDSSIWLSDSDLVDRVVADDQRAVVDMLPAVEQIVSASGFTPVIIHTPQYETAGIVVSYKFYFQDSAENEVAYQLASDVTLVMPLSKTAAVNIQGLAPALTYSDYDYAVFYNNGVEDINIGGTVNPDDGTVSVVTRRTGVYKVKRVIRSQSFSISWTEPRKIFTPNGDGRWDKFNIKFENPAQLAITSAKVFDLSGAEIASLQTGDYGPYSLAWDGYRSNGDKAPSGIYIYQFKAGDKFYNGTMVLAR